MYSSKLNRALCRRLEALILLLLFVFPLYTGVADAALRDRYEAPVSAKGDFAAPTPTPSTPAGKEATKPVATKESPPVEPTAVRGELPAELSDFLAPEDVAEYTIYPSAQEHMEELGRAHLGAMTAYINAEFVAARFIDIMTDRRYTKNMDQATFERMSKVVEVSLKSARNEFRSYEKALKNAEMAMGGWTDEERNLFAQAIGFFCATPAEALAPEMQHASAILGSYLNGMTKQLNRAIDGVVQGAKDGFNSAVDRWDTFKKEHNVAYGVGMVGAGVATVGLGIAAVGGIAASAPVAAGGALLFTAAATVKVTAAGISGTMMIMKGTASIAGKDMKKIDEATSSVTDFSDIFGGTATMAKVNNAVQVLYNTIKVLAATKSRADAFWAEMDKKLEVNSSAYEYWKNKWLEAYNEYQELYKEVMQAMNELEDIGETLKLAGMGITRDGGGGGGGGGHH